MKKLILFICILSASAFANEHKPTTTPDNALKWLMNGNGRFLKTSSLRKDGQSPKDVARLSTGQSPHSIVLSCSDSRVPPEIVFDQKLGEIFVVRTAGETLGDNAVGSIEYAVEHLGSRLIVVMGHTACGAVKAAHGTLDGKSAGSPALDGLVHEIHPHLARFKGTQPSPNWAAEGTANADGVAHELVKRSAILNKKWQSGELWIVPALYDLNSGKVAFQDRYVSDVKRVPTEAHAH